MNVYKARVCHISTVHKWNDIRIFQKQCTSLSKAGFEVHLIVPCRSPIPKHENVQIHCLRTPKNRLDRIFRLTKEAFQRATEVDAQVYHIHDPELLPTALKLKQSGKKVIYDAHENTPATIYDKEWIPFKVFRGIVSNFFTAYENFVAGKLDAVISVAEPLLERFENNRKVLIRNLPILSKFEGTELSKTLEAAVPGVIYAGGLTSIRNIITIVDALALSNKCEYLHLFGEWESEAYFDECKKSQGWSKVCYWGFKESSEVYTFMKEKGQIGLVLFDGGVKNHQIALPNKAFEYMAAGLPIIMSDIPYWRQNFADIAVFVDPRNAEEIAHTMDELYKQPERLHSLSRKGLDKIKSLNWDAESHNLNKLYNELVSNG